MFGFQRALLIGFQAFFYFLITNPEVEARSVEATRFESTGGKTVWFRLENREVQMDFAPENAFRIDSVQLTQSERELAGIVEENPTFWIDQINGEGVLATSTKLLNPNNSEESAALEVSGGPLGKDSDRISLFKTVRLFPEGAQFEIHYRLENLTSESLPVAYSVRLPWKIASDSSEVSYYLPSSGSVRKIGNGALADSVEVEGLEITGPWFSATSLKDDLSCLFVSDQPLVSWSGNRGAGADAVVEAVVWEGALKPGEKQEGTLWVAAVSGLGEPISASGRYAVGAVWKPGNRFDTYCLETRFVGMPLGLRQFRIFSGVRRNSSSVAMVPVYTRRSKLSPTAVYSIPMPGSYEEGAHWLEQSVYSGSENLGYWNLALPTPGDARPQIASTPSGPMTSLSYFIPPEGDSNPSADPIRAAAASEDYQSDFPHSGKERTRPENPSADEIALLEWPIME